MLNQIVIPENDPVAVADKRALIDQSLEENKDRPGGLMVILNEVQSKVGFISEPMQIVYRQPFAHPRQYRPRGGFVLFILHHHSSRPPHD